MHSVQHVYLGRAIGRRMVRELNKFLATPVTKGVSLYIIIYKKLQVKATFLVMLVNTDILKHEAAPTLPT